VALLLLPTLHLPAHPAQAAPPTLDLSARLRATDKALHWLYDQQNADGGFGQPSSDPQITCETVLAFASAYEEPATVQSGDNSPLDYLATQVVTQTNSAEGTALLILAAVAGEKNPSAFGGEDITAMLDDYYVAASGRYRGPASDGIAAQALAIMAKRASSEALPAKAVTWLKDRQNDDGGWGTLPGQPSDTKNTALSLQALIAAGESTTSPAVSVAILCLRDRWTEDTGFASSSATSISDPASTAQAIQALLAGGENLLSNKWRRCLNTPLDALVDAQAGDGSFDNDLELTSAAVPGLMGSSLPLPGRFLAAARALDWLHTQQGNDGGFGNGGVTADAVYAIALCQQEPDGPNWTKNGISALDALEAQTQDYIDAAPAGGPAGELGKVIRAVSQTGADPHDFAGLDLVAQLQELYGVPSPGLYHPFKTYSHDLALIALQAVGETIPGMALTKLEDAQLASGGWPWSWTAPTADIDSTGLSMQAIVAAGGPSSPSITANAAALLESLRFSGGGYPDLATKSEPNCDSTSLAIQGLLASGSYRQEPLLFVLGTGAVSSSWDALLAFQEPAGSFIASISVPESRVLATVEAIHALASPLYPNYEPLAEGETTEAGTVQGLLTCGDGLVVVAPYYGDDNNDGSASVRYRAVGALSWSSGIDMGKRGLHYVELLDLEVASDYEIEVSYHDPEGVTGTATQSLSIYLGKVCIPVALRSYAG